MATDTIETKIYYDFKNYTLGYNTFGYNFITPKKINMLSINTTYHSHINASSNIQERRRMKFDKSFSFSAAAQYSPWGITVF